MGKDVTSLFDQTMAAELQRIFTELGLEDYLPSCLLAGIQDWKSLSTVTEAELIAIGIRAGHRRKLQRKIAQIYSWPDRLPLPSAAELQRHRQNLSGLARGHADPEVLEENYYSLTSPVQSPWSAETRFSNDTEGSFEELQDGTHLLVMEILKTSSRLFPIVVSNCAVCTEREEHLVPDALVDTDTDTDTRGRSRTSGGRKDTALAGWLSLSWIPNSKSDLGWRLPLPLRPIQVAQE
jgi:hypothetical protein